MNLRDREPVPRPARRVPLAGLWRLLALGLAAWLIHIAAARLERSELPAAVSLEAVRPFHPAAAALSPPDTARGARRVLDAGGRPIGHALTTSPQTDDIIGYTAPNNVLVVLDATGVVVGLRLMEGGGGDTAAHLAEVRRARGFWDGFLGWAPAREPPPRIEAVAGSTLTSLGIAEAVERRLAGRAPSLRFPDPVSLDEVRVVFPEAATLHGDGPRPGWLEVRDAAGRRVGYAVRTSPQAESVRGHAGPTEALAFVGRDGRNLRAVRLRRSFDTPDYVDRVREDEGFLGQLAGRTVEAGARLDFARAGIEGVSGATETSYAVAEGLRRRLAADLAVEKRSAVRSGWRARDWALLAVVAGAGGMAFGGLRRRPWVRRTWQVIVVGVFGLWCGDLISLALVAGVAEHGRVGEVAPALVLLLVCALLVPWASGKALYCHHLCPHGVVQEWLGRVRRWRVAVPARAVPWLERLPAVLIGGAFLMPLAGWSLDLAGLEPFDAWTLTRTAVVSGVIALVGLGASLFVPMAYCRYGCPTGALLKFVRDGAGSSRFEARDGVALLLLVVGAGLVLMRSVPDVAARPVSEPGVVLGGLAFGTTWSVKLRGPVPDRDALERMLAAELEEIEGTFSHWGTNSATAQFNASGTTLPVEMPPALVALVARCLDLSRASDGAFDITVAPLVRAYGFGPGGVPVGPTSDADIADLLGRTGWRKLDADTLQNTLRKSHPGLQIDLGAILQGYAADRLGAILTAGGPAEFLVEVGGELLARGSWRVVIEDPVRTDRVLRTLTLTDAALATSGTYRTRRTEGGQARSHIVDPVTGRPVRHDTVLVSVMRASAAEADAWATALLVRGADDALRLARSRDIAVLEVREGGGGRSVAVGGAFPVAEGPDPFVAR